MGAETNLDKVLLRASKKPITLITSTDVIGTSRKLPFLLGGIDAKNSESFKMIIAQKQFTKHSISAMQELISSFHGESPVRMDAMNIQSDSNLSVLTYTRAHLLIMEELNSNQSQLTYLILEDFDGETCIELEILLLALELTGKNKKFSIIIVSDGLAPDTSKRVKVLCEDIPVEEIDLLHEISKRPERECVVSNGNEIKENIYSRVEATTVLFNNERGLSISEMKEMVTSTVRLMEYFFDLEEANGWNDPFSYAVFTSTPMISLMVKDGIYERASKNNVYISVLHHNNDIGFLTGCEKKHHIILVNELVEDAFYLDNLNVVFDMGLTTVSDRVQSTGRTVNKTIYADRVKLIRRANRIVKGVVAYPLGYGKTMAMRSRAIKRTPGFDLDFRFYHDSRDWAFLLNDESSDRLMERAEKISIRSGLISSIDSSFCTPMGSFCWSILSLLPLHLSKLILCGFVCGCEEAAINLAALLAEENAQRECSKNMHQLMKMVQLKDVESEHLAMLYAVKGRFEKFDYLFSRSANKSLDRRIEKIRYSLKMRDSHPGVCNSDREVEQRLLITVGMAFGDRIAYTDECESRRTRIFHCEDVDNGCKKVKFQTPSLYTREYVSAGVYWEIRDMKKENEIRSTTEVSLIPLSILAAVGNIGGRAVKTEKGLALTTNTGVLHVEVSEKNQVDEMLSMRKEVEKEVERVALSFLESQPIQCKKKRDGWMDQLISILDHTDTT